LAKNDDSSSIPLTTSNGKNGKNEKIFRGIAAAPGISFGLAYVYSQMEVVIRRTDITLGEVESELLLYRQALERSAEELEKIYDLAKEKLGESLAEIFQGHLMMLHDPVLTEAIENRVRGRLNKAEYAVASEFEKYASRLRDSADDLLHERMQDLEDVKNRLIRNLQRKRLTGTIEGGRIIFSRKLTPADTVLFSRHNVLGYVTETGGMTSHAAIISRSLNIPAVVAVPGILNEVNDGDLVIIDGYKGLVYINPSDTHLAECRKKIAEIENIAKKLETLRDLHCETTDGHVVELAANAEFVEEVEYIRQQGADGIGLYRTEHLYLLREEFPSEQEQFLVYHEIAEAMHPRPVIFRVFDIGGDKVLDSSAREGNPFMGWRGIRLLLDQPDIFRAQLRAILRASRGGNVKIMFPMISGLVVLKAAVDFLDGVKEELRHEGVPFDEEIKVGAMIEVPSAVLIADVLAREVDFFSIGTNDLIQYLLAVDRGNELISELYQEFHPAVLHAIRMVIESAHRNNIWVGLCGEMAGNPYATPLLLGMGIDEFSVIPSVLPEIKHIVRSFSFKEAEELARRALDAKTHEEVREWLIPLMHDRFPEFFTTTMT